ncbi:MAG: hypothetical protein U0641_05835 [Anaerolineae bacterium]
MDKKLYCVVYRTGDEENFKWQRTEGMPRDEAIQRRKELREVPGVKTLRVNFYSSCAIGLPEGYEYETWKEER